MFVKKNLRKEKEFSNFLFIFVRKLLYLLAFLLEQKIFKLNASTITTLTITTNIKSENNTKQMDRLF